jgi:(1->4)-alpha-D-glucan 1-alpha-D-glucosylmutase
VDAILTRETGADFLDSFGPKAQRLAHLGIVNSLAQVVLKCTVPGVPDFYQGSELWNLTLVDPDNRRLVDWEPHERLAKSAMTENWRELLTTWGDGRVKLRLTAEVLRFRRGHPAVFMEGEYVALKTSGRFSDRVIAFARRTGRETVVVVVPRLSAMLGSPPLGLVWEDTTVMLPTNVGALREILTGRDVRRSNGSSKIALADLFAELPVAILAVS